MSLSASLLFSGCSNSVAHRKDVKNENNPNENVYTLGLTAAQKDSIRNLPASKRISRDMAFVYAEKLKRSGFNGAILVARKGVVLYENYNGFEDFKTRTPLTDSSSFQLASVSKTFTGMAIMHLVEKAQLSLEDSLQHFFPDFPYKGITVRMLLNHRSGLPNYLYFCDSLWPDRNKLMTNNDVIGLMIKHRPRIQHLPNTHFQYCNTNYLLLASIVEKVSGEKFPDFMQHTFFQPLDMYNTFVDDGLRPKRPHQTVSHDFRGRPEPDVNFDGVVGDKGIYSTAQDMLKWDQALYSGKLFSDATLKEAFQPYSNEKPGIRNYGLGWRLMVYPDSTRNIVYHNGWWHGNNTVFYRFVHDSTTLVILGNRYNRAIYHAVKPIREVLGQADGEEAGAE
ncbi:beta-lactamase family protein [Chitinophaga horti]|uniref:Beta-lactamase family protein n=1 Tax=Chitinophaga horti TaxID=2920382 RepID=A0ABY6J683_9BACT|nr:serine hydrolase domain-containing protein [Chitinophaga horti]UYQ95193.1 beta-lactamase family protein [Chitinophaga horti]